MLSADLYRLQEIDHRKQILEERLAGLPAAGETAGLQEQLARARGELAEKKREIGRLEKERKRCELDAAGAAAKKKELAARLYGGAVSNLKELEKLEKMISDCQKQEEAAEDRELDLLLQADRLGAAAACLQAEADALKEMLSVKEGEYSAAAESIRAEMSELPRLRREILDRLDDRMAGQYEALRKKISGLAVVPVHKQTCGGCRIVLSMGTMQELRDPNRLVRCENCGRILYWRGE